MFNKFSLLIILLSIAPQTLWAFDYLQVLPSSVEIPVDNHQTQAKIDLGKRLYFDRRLSTTGTHSCNDCHNLAQGGDDGRSFSVGPNNTITKRSAPSLWNIGFQTVLYWDGRAKSLELQAEDHLVQPNILGHESSASLIKILSELPEYQQLFGITFGEKDISLMLIAKAVASFERTLLTKNSPFDNYIRGDKNALSASAIRGIKAFNDTGCLACHFGVNFAGPAPGPAMSMGDGFYELFPNTLGSQYDISHHLTDDLGRFEFSGSEDEKYMWRVPSLRNIELTAPYFHNGSALNLNTAIKIMAKTQFNKEISTKEISDIASFLRSLTGVIPELNIEE